MADYPLCFRVSYDIPVRDSVARVIVQGRALMVFEDDEWWCHGVEPGGMTQHGGGPAAAFAAFKSTFKDVLEETAEDASSLEEFRTAVQEFVSTRDEIDARRWDEARDAIRAVSRVEFPFDRMRRETSEWKADTVVKRLEEVAADEGDVALAQSKPRAA